MKTLFYQLIIFVSLCASAFTTAGAQSFDLRPQTNNTKKGDETLLSYLDKNDVEGMRTYLYNNKAAVNTNSRVIKSDNGAKQPLPLFFDAVNRALFNQENGSVEMCKVIIDAGCDLHPVFDGRTPIYLLMEFFATHKKSECENAIKILKAFDSRRDWNANQRYRSELPPINYLIRRNYEFLNKHFSSEYIDDEVLRILIGHGASTSSYTDEGKTLMTFAIETDNQFLQAYFLNNDVNLMHQDESGHNDLYRLIESNNLSILKDAYHKGKLELNINTLKNNPNDFVKNKELYDFVSGICADNANSYEDLVAFRKRFPQENSVVNTKYENLARKETLAANDFDAIMHVKERFPDLSVITDPQFVSIYKADVRRVDAAYQNALNDAKSLNYHCNKEPFLEIFVRQYSSRANYDPDNKVPLAKEILDYYYVCNVCVLPFGKYMWESLLGTILRFDENKMNEDHKQFDRALNLANSHCNSPYGFSSFYKKAVDQLRVRKNEWENDANNQIAEYNQKIEKRRNYHSSSSTITSNEEVSAGSGNVDIENITINDFKYEIDKKWGDSVGDLLMGRQRKEIYFTDKEGAYSGYIFKENHENDVYIDFHGHHYYDSLENAIVALYVLKKYGKMREKGQK